jgi:flagellar hook-length control protein FliK
MQTALQQDISPAISAATPVPVTLSPASSQQPGQEATTNNNTLEATRSVQAAAVSEAEKMGTEAVPPERGKVSIDGQGSVSGSSVPQNEVRTAGQAQDVVSAQDAPVAEIPAASTAKTAQTEPQQVVQPAESGVMPVQVAASPAFLQERDQTLSAIYQALEGTGSAQAAVVPAAGKTGVAVGGEAVQTQPESAAAAMPVQSSAVEAVKLAGAGSSGGEFSPGDDKGTADNFMNGQFHATLMHQQGNVDGASVADNVSTPVQNDVQQSGLSEQILQQVRDRLVNHDLKAGNDQIVLRLSPENLGDLKLNLSMDGQRLKIEIVADNHMVRDALLQNTGSLKESLARQNISMESFDVTTGGRGAGNSGQGQQQSDWRGFAQQKQQNAWMSSGGYRLPEATTVPGQSAYQTPSQHAMVDLHF